MLARFTRSAAVFAAIVAALLVAVAVAVTILRALDARGVELAGMLLDAMGAARTRRPAAVHPYRTPAPVNRRRVRVLARHAGAVFGAEEHAGWDECAACDGTGEGTYGRSCSRCAGRGEVKVRTERDLDAEEARGWRIALAGG